MAWVHSTGSRGDHVPAQSLYLLVQTDLYSFSFEAIQRIEFFKDNLHLLAIFL